MTRSRDYIDWQKGPAPPELERPSNARVHGVKPRLIVKIKDLSQINEGNFSAADLFVQESVDFPDLASKAKFRQALDQKLLERTRHRFKEVMACDKSAVWPSLEHWHDTVIEDEKQGHELVAELRKLGNVEKAYMLSGPVEPPMAYAAGAPLSTHQLYLNPAPMGINARFAWTIPGGDGEKQRLADVEWGWNLDHVGLKGINFIEKGQKNYDYVDHGTKVLGVIAARDNAMHCVGITPKLETVVTCGQWKYQESIETGGAILLAISELSQGDVLLLEAQTRKFGYTNIPVEAEPWVFDLVKLATDLGIIVIAAAGNGDVNLDKVEDEVGIKLFDVNSPRSRPDSGAIIVASAWPHFNSHDQPEWHRLGNSCYGSRIDCFACGDGVVTLSSDYSGQETDRWTSGFSATSAASAIVAGAALSIQGIMDKSANSKLSPDEMRRILSDPRFNTKSVNHPADLIGVMPDLYEIISRL